MPEVQRCYAILQSSESNLTWNRLIHHKFHMIAKMRYWVHLRNIQTLLQTPLKPTNLIASHVISKNLPVCITGSTPIAEFFHLVKKQLRQFTRLVPHSVPQQCKYLQTALIF